MKQIYDYMDYREFLKDFFLEKKQQLAFYSYRLFSQKAGLKSPNFLKLVIEGERNLSKESVFKFSKALSLGKKESDYFENLVFFNQSKSIEEKSAYLARVMRYRLKADPKKVEENEFAYYSQWYNPIVQELVTAVDFQNDYKKLGSCVNPPISAQDAQKSVELLLSLGFIKKSEDGRYVKTHSAFSTGPQVRSVAVANYHKEMIRLGQEAIERFNAKERDISSITLHVTEETYRTIISKIQQFRREILEMEDDGVSTQKVIQMNVQIFPVSSDFENRQVNHDN